MNTFVDLIYLKELYFQLHSLHLQWNKGVFVAVSREGKAKFGRLSGAQLCLQGFRPKKRAFSAGARKERQECLLGKWMGGTRNLHLHSLPSQTTSLMLFLTVSILNDRRQCALTISKQVRYPSVLFSIFSPFLPDCVTSDHPPSSCWISLSWCLLACCIWLDVLLLLL